MELRHLRYFIAVAEQENVSRAALKLYLSQPALSRQIRDLEDELGFLLLQRTAKSVRLTEAGRVFLIEARAILQRVADGVATARTVAGGKLGEIHVGYAPSLTARILPPALRAFQAERPGVRVKLHDLSSAEMLAGLKAREIDVALMPKSDSSSARGFQFQELARDPMRVAVGLRHPFASRQTLPLSSIARQPLIIFRRQDYPEYFQDLSRRLAKFTTKPDITEEHDSVTSLIAAVEAGNGVALVGESISCISGPRLKLIPLKPESEPIIVGIGWLKSNLTASAERFVQVAIGAAQKSGP